MDVLWFAVSSIALPQCSGGSPSPILEWMMTDTCGLANSGTTATGLLMQLRKSGQPYVPSYMASPSTYFGNSVVYPGIVGYYGEANGTSVVYPDLTKSTTVSMYLWANAAPSSSYVNVFEYGIRVLCRKYLHSMSAC